MVFNSTIEIRANYTLIVKGLSLALLGTVGKINPCFHVKKKCKEFLTIFKCKDISVFNQLDGNTLGSMKQRFNNKWNNYINNREIN